jgi:hypothetical protein
MKAVIQNSELSPSNPLHVAVFRLQCGMEYVAAAMHWYASETVGRSPLPDHQSLVALSLYLAGTAEVLHLFHELARKQVLVPTTDWSSDATNAWGFLLSDEVVDFKNQQLRRVRDKTAFHVDPEPVRCFLEEESKEPGKTVLMEDSDDFPHGFSPAAATILGRWLLSQGLATSKSAKLADAVYSALRQVVSKVLLEAFPNVRAEA